MIHSLSNSEIYTPKGFLDEVASQTTSSVSYRLSRKQNQSSASRRSSKNSSEGSVEALDLSKFYVKMTPKQEKIGQGIRPTIIKRTIQAQRLKRRSPTPARTKKGKAETPKKDQQQQMEKDLTILELQRRCSEQQKIKELLQKRVGMFQKELKVKLKKIDELQRKNADLVQKEENTFKKLLEFQEISSINQNNLNQAKSSLEKLKSIIKKNRCQELELQNSKLIQQNATLAQELAVSNQQNAKNKEIIARLEEDLRSLRRENLQLAKGSQLKQKNLEIEKLKQILNASKSQKEEQLQKLIVQKSEAQMRQRLRAEKSQIQLAYLNRKKNEEIQQLKLKHGQLINKIRTKLWVLSEKYADLREQHERLKSKGVIPFPRRSLLLTDHRPTEDMFLFDLSP